MTDNKSKQKTTVSTSKRKLLIGLAGLGAISSIGSSTASAQDPQGSIGSPDNPYLRAYIDRVVFVPRSSDPTDPDDGAMWFRGDL